MYNVLTKPKRFYFRSTAMAVTLAAGRFGAILANVVFGYFIAVSCAVPILSVAALLVSGGLVEMKLDELLH